MKLLGLVLALAACGDNTTPTCADASVCGDACPVTFAGNFAESTLSAGNCPTLSASLDFAIDSPLLGAKVMIELDLGANPPAGNYSSETVTSWHAIGARSIGDGACVYSAGDQSTPTGSFALSLTAVDPAHGTLDVLQTVQALAGTDCGAASTETIAVVF